MRMSDRRSKHRGYIPADTMRAPHIHCNCEGCGQILKVKISYLQDRGIKLPTTAVIPGVRCAQCEVKA